MTKKFLEFNTSVEAQAFANNASKKMGYPNKGALRYTKVVQHPSSGRAICKTCPKCHSLMNAEQIAALIDPSNIIALGYFPELAI